MIPAPDIFIVGAQKAGTTTLTAHLAASPAVVGTHPSLECTYYASAEEHALGGDAAAARYFPACVTSECHHVHLAKNVDVLPDTDAHGRLHGGAPDVRLVCVLRNPVDRAYSAYLWARAVGLEGSPDFTTALERHGTATIDGWPTHGNYLLNGRYCEQLEALECTFPRNRMHIVFFDDLVADTAACLERLFWKLDLPPAAIDTSTIGKPARQVRSVRLARLMYHPNPNPSRLRDYVWRLNRRPAAPPPLPLAERGRLQNYYEDPDAELASYLGRTLPWRVAAS
jgi:Sulfotransferase domain